ncbi:hypothetical protein TanjilG_05267 [Lupinus angustifolius]|uniref:Uncharacterized protein n=1 Tax=Lupinus angustifolius TaxID=3871 RepID=A0A4P1RB51_LUPAN|nr:hypothetical protein TanjilG_05267 [Lupinus angustifolius]
MKEVHGEEDTDNNTNTSFFNGIEEPPKVEEEDDDIGGFVGFSESVWWILSELNSFIYFVSLEFYFNSM